MAHQKRRSFDTFRVGSLVSIVNDADETYEVSLGQVDSNHNMQRFVCGKIKQDTLAIILQPNPPQNLDDFVTTVKAIIIIVDNRIGWVFASEIRDP